MDRLAVLISDKRAEMVKLGMGKGFTHPDTVQASQELDKLINKAMKDPGN